MSILVLIKCIKKQNNKFGNIKSYYEINKNDMFSLENALRIKDETGCKVIAVTVGATNVQPIVKKLYYFGVDEVVLISDISIAGSDTYATSMVLKSFIEKKDINLVFAGKESSDSSTAQIGPQISALLNYNLAVSVETVQYSNTNKTVTCSFKDSGNLYSVNYELPLVVVSEINSNNLRIPKISDFLLAKDKKVNVLNLNDISLSPLDCGSCGSLTKVINVEDVLINCKNSTQIESNISLSIFSEIINARDENNIPSRITNKNVESTTDKHKVLIIPDFTTVHLKSICKNVISHFCENSNTSVLLFDEFSKHSNELSDMGIEMLFLSDIKRNTINYYETGKEIANLLKKLDYNFVLLISSPFNRVIAPIVAALLKTGLTADCSEITVNEDGFMYMTRPTFGDSKKATIICHKTNPQMATIRPSCFLNNNYVSGKCQCIRINANHTNKSEKFTILSKEKIEQLEWNRNVVLIAGGGLSKISVLKLKDISKKLNLDFGATRATVDKGFVNHEYQIGQTGVSITHNLCVCFGVSGAIEHTVGISKTSRIISVNTDINCIMNKTSDIFAVTDANKIISEIGEIVL